MMLRKFFLGLVTTLLMVSTAGCFGSHGRHLSSHAWNRWTYTGHLTASVIHRGRKIAYRDFGIGVITNVGVMGLANDALWPAPSGAAMNVLALSLNCATGTGGTAAASTDITLQSWDSIAPAVGTPTLASAANSQSEKITCTQSYASPENVSEFALLNGASVSSSTGTPWTGGSATTGVVTGTPFTPSSATVRGVTQNVFVDTTKSPAIYILATFNINNTVTGPAWYKVTDGTAAGTFPANSDTLVEYPLMLDHLQFTAIPVQPGDSIQFVFTLFLPSGS